MSSLKGAKSRCASIGRVLYVVALRAPSFVVRCFRQHFPVFEEMLLRSEERFRLHHVFGAFLAGTATPGCVALRAFDNLIRGVAFGDPRVPTLERAFPGLTPVTNRVGRLKFDEPLIQLLRALRGEALMRFTECAGGDDPCAPTYMVSF